MLAQMKIIGNRKQGTLSTLHSMTFLHSEASDAKFLRYYTGFTGVLFYNWLQQQIQECRSSSTPDLYALNIDIVLSFHLSKLKVEAAVFSVYQVYSSCTTFPPTNNQKIWIFYVAGLSFGLFRSYPCRITKIYHSLAHTFFDF